MVNLSDIIPEAFHDLLTPARYKVYYGGRGGAKSWAYARSLILLADAGCIRILCAREFQTSIADSVYKLLVDQIAAFGWYDRFDITKIEITHKITGSAFIFKGLRRNSKEIKSTEGIDICWVEEAESTSAESWKLIIPTIRKPGSEIWISFNPDQEKDPTYQKFVVNPPPKSIVKKVSHRDNPYFPEELRLEMEHLKRVDYDAYLHVWEGECWSRSAAQVLNGKWIVDDFIPAINWNGPYFGADWGFSTDPMAVIKFWIGGRKLYIEYEIYETGVEIDDTPSKFAEIDGTKTHVVRADNARPELISHMQRHEYPKLVAAPKWPGSVEDGVSWLRSFDQIVIHPRCKNAAEEARLWSYKIDKQTEEILPVLVDKYNHIWDAVRYGASPMIRKAKGGVFVSDVTHIPPKARYAQVNGQWAVDVHGPLLAWQEPVANYVVGAVYEWSGAGVSSISVVDQATGRQVAHIEQYNGSLNEFTQLIASVCQRYVNAWAVVDISHQGIVIINQLRKIHRRVYSEIPPEAKTGGAAKTRRFGFDGQHFLNQLIRQLAADVDTGSHGMLNEDTINELGSFSYSDDGEIEIIPGLGHERVLSFCLARHGVATLPKARNFAAEQVVQTQSGGGWAGHV